MTTGLTRAISFPVPRPIDEAETRLQRLLGLSPRDAARAVSEILDCFTQDVDQYVGARHAELQEQGAQNQEIYQRIASELQAIRFAAPPLSERQIRRRVYG